MKGAGVYNMHKIKCFECGSEITDPFLDACPKCGGILTIETDLDAVANLKPKDLREKPLNVWRYAPFLPVKCNVSLLEGGTPLYDCRALSKQLGVKEVYVKYEGANPTGSFKDRGMTVGVSKAIELGCQTVGCASTGNTSASLAAYAAKGGLNCVVLLPSGKVAAGKLAQAMFYGAKVVMVNGNFDDALNVVKSLADERVLYLLNSINPYRPEGQKTLAFEIVDQLNFEVPDRIIIPVGNAANIWAVYKALSEWKALGWIDKMPKLTGIQAEGAAPVAKAFKEGSSDFQPELNPETIATAIRIGNPASGRKALKAIYDTKGYSTTVTDAEILDAQKLLGRKEGVGVEPASAASIAGLVKLRNEGVIDSDERVVCVCTGNVLKDPDTVIKSCGNILNAEPNVTDVKRVID